MEEEEGEVPRRGGEEADKEGEMSILVEERKADGVTSLGDTPVENRMKFHTQTLSSICACIHEHVQPTIPCICYKSQDRLKW